jgi:hypothetical protein
VWLLFAFSRSELTNLSIVSRLDFLEQEGRLIGYVPTVIAGQDGPPRQLWLTVDAHAWCFPKGKHPEKIREMALAMASSQLNHFALGTTMIEDDDMKHLTPHSKEVWTIRSYLERPQLRLFGWFVQPRQFIVVHGKSRDDLERAVGPKWDRAIQKVIDARSQLFPGLAPYSGYTFSDYVG